MPGSFFFYDLETSGFSPRSARIMQFAGQRTDLGLKPIGEPVNFMIRLAQDVLPEPDAVLLTGITPQQTLAEGLSEAEFLDFFYKNVVQPDTIFAGFNSIRFDDEFMRFLHYRNFYDAYAWQWQDGCSRWDILDVTRMTRALRPDGIIWPFAPDGKPTNRLEYLTSVNKIEHVGAHDALSDVRATIAVAKLLKDKQGDLFSYLLSIRNKKQVAGLVNKNEPFIYTSSHYPSSVMHTTAVVSLSPSPTRDAALVYDLRHDPTPFLKMTVDQLIEAWRYNDDPKVLRLPVKTLKFNRVPAVAPLGVIKDKTSQKNIALSIDLIQTNLRKLMTDKADFSAKILKATDKMDELRAKEQTALIEDQLSVDERLYDGFFDDRDSRLIAKVRSLEPDQLTSDQLKFEDARLKQLLPLYKARNYPKSLNDQERRDYDEFCRARLISGGNSSRLAKYFSRLDELGQSNANKREQYLIEELLLYGQSLVPLAETDN